MLIRQELSSFLLSTTRFCHKISITGAGGKTTLLNLFSSIYKPLGNKIMLTTTTHLAKDVKYNVDKVVMSLLDYDGEKSILYVNEDEDSSKYKSPGEKNIANLSRYFDKVIIEADGSASLPLKYHREKDPVIIPQTSWNFSILGLDCFSENIEDVMFSNDLYFQEFPFRRGKRAELIDIENLYYSPNGVLKGLDRQKTTILLNKADTITDMSFLKKIISFAEKIGAVVTSFEKGVIFCDSAYSF